MKRVILLLLFIVCGTVLLAQEPDSIRTIYVHILHGSRPDAPNEYKSIGGYRGGHVVTQVDTFVYGFNFRSRKIHTFPSRKNNSGIFEKEGVVEWRSDKKKFKITTFAIDVSIAQHDSLQALYEKYLQGSPYDYAFFGMRCAASSYHMLGCVQVIEPCSRARSVRKAFHPKALRKRLVAMAEEKKFRIIVQKGSRTRKWEGD
jgi:hypothetical protein